LLYIFYIIFIYIIVYFIIIIIIIFFLSSVLCNTKFIIEWNEMEWKGDTIIISD